MITPMKTLTAQQATILLRRMTMAEMRALLAIRSCGTLTRAAQSLQVSQPAISQQLREVEEKLGVPLFVRHRRGLEPTAAGEVMLRLAQALGEDMRVAAQELALSMKERGTPLRIGSMAAVSAGLLALATGRHATQMATSSIIVREGPREQLLEHLRHRRIDLFVGRLPNEESTQDLLSETLFLEAGVVIASARHPLARRGRLAPEQLQDWQWILPAEETTFYKQISQSLRASGIALPPARIQTFSLLAIPAVVATSDMLGFLPSSMFGSGTLSTGLQQLAVPIDWSAAPVGVLMRRGETISEDMQAFLEILRSVSASARGALLQTR